MNWFAIDPKLPALAAAFDNAVISQGFAQQWAAGSNPKSRSTQHITITYCRRQDVQYSPMTRCIMTYSLAATVGEQASTPSLGVVEVTPAGLQQKLYGDDPKLPGLALAADGEMIGLRLAALTGASGVCAATPVRYKPGARCTFRYDLPTGTSQRRYFGKLLAQQQAAPLHAIATALYQASQTEAALPRIAEPLVFWSDLGMAVQAAVAGEELHTLAFDPQLASATRLAWVQAAGRVTAALHTLAGSIGSSLPGAPRTLAADLAELAEYHPALRQVDAPLADRFVAAIATLTAATQHQPELPSVVSHGALRTDQFMCMGERLAMIDLDSIGYASPARDLGNFLAYLTWKALRQPHLAEFITNAQQAFFNGYTTMRTLPSAEWLAYYQAASLLKILGRRYTGLTYQEWPLTERLLETAIQIRPQT